MAPDKGSAQSCTLEPAHTACASCCRLGTGTRGAHRGRSPNAPMPRQHVTLGSRCAQHAECADAGLNLCAGCVWPAIQRQRLPPATDCAVAAGHVGKGSCMHAHLPPHGMGSCRPSGETVHLWARRTALMLHMLCSLQGCGPAPVLIHASSPAPGRTPPHHSHPTSLTCARTSYESALSLQGRERMLPPQPSQPLQAGAQGQQRTVFGGGDRAPSMELLSQLKETGWPPPVRCSWPLKAAG